jgi:hypothetical protein
MRIYEGTRTVEGCVVTADGRPLNLRLDLRMHADKPEWGYGGSGPAQLALGLLADALGDDEAALDQHQRFKRDIVAGFERERWLLTQAEIRSWIYSVLTKDELRADDPPPEA